MPLLQAPGRCRGSSRVLLEAAPDIGDQRRVCLKRCANPYSLGIRREVSLQAARIFRGLDTFPKPGWGSRLKSLHFGGVCLKPKPLVLESLWIISSPRPPRLPNGPFWYNVLIISCPRPLRWCTWYQATQMFQSNFGGTLNYFLSDGFL